MFSRQPGWNMKKMNSFINQSGEANHKFTGSKVFLSILKLLILAVIKFKIDMNI